MLYCGIEMVDNTHSEQWFGYALDAIGVSALCVGIGRSLILRNRHNQNSMKIRDPDEDGSTSEPSGGVQLVISTSAIDERTLTVYEPNTTPNLDSVLDSFDAAADRRSVHDR